MRIVETNCETDETTERDMTAEELQDHEAEIALSLELQAQLESSILAKESAVAKLLALGLTEEEARSLVGASAPMVEPTPEEPLAPQE